jgi:hypothetical protein
MSEYQEEVLTNLLDLQAELRGDEPEPRPEPQADKPAAEADPVSVEPVIADEANEDTVTVTLPDQGVAVSVAPTGMPVTERLAALNERLAQLERELAGVTKRIERIEPDEQVEGSAETETDVDAPWRSFIDLQRIVADRLDHS